MIRFFKKPTYGGKYYGFCKDILESGHTIIAGATGSGKSVLLNDILYSAMAHSPKEYRFVLIDPKRVELSMYRNIAHVDRYVQNPSDAVDVLHDVIALMEKRFHEMEKRKLRNYDGSKLFVVIDELADLLISAESKEVKRCIQKITQLGRAASIFMIVCTQQPSRKMLDASLTLNFTTRIALRCNSPIESRQIINAPGAECLPRYGQAIIMTPEDTYIQEIPLTSDEEIYDRIKKCAR